MNRSETERHWQDLIVDHSQFPRRHGRLDPSSHHGEGENPLCGDRVRLYLQVDDAGVVKDARFEATGCAISLASASILADALVGLDMPAARELFDAAHARLTGVAGDGDAGPGDLDALRLVGKFPLRVKCASLCWHVLRQALDGARGRVTTE